MPRQWEATMAAKGLTTTQWLVIAFIILLAAVLIWEAAQDLIADRQIMRGMRGS
jgi:hypothetical protein